MTINPYDDYEKLAKLLYPSIEASGNVYYGQTRKLTMDEVLDKNDLGFESHVETISDSVELNKFTCSKFCWKLGPLSGSIFVNTESLAAGRVCVNTFIDNSLEFKTNNLSNDNYSSYYAKYKISKSNSAVDNILANGNYKTYEAYLNVTLESIVATHGEDPIDSGYSKNFCIDEENLYLYILILRNAPYDSTLHYSKESDQELYLVNIGDSSDLVSLMSESTANHNTYEYRKSDMPADTWLPMQIVNSIYTDPVTSITLNPGESVSFRCTHYEGQDYSSAAQMYIRGTAPVEAYGNVMSLIDADNFKSITDISDSIYNACFYGLFSNQRLLVRPPVLPCTKLSAGCYHSMFRNTSIKYPPVLKATSLAQDCYNSMFWSCDQLLTAPTLSATMLKSGCYCDMFRGCGSLINQPKYLPAANCTADCYKRMFSYCNSLQKSPIIMCVGLDDRCMEEMFIGCTSLNEVTCLYRDLTFNNNMLGWLDNVSSTGTLYVSPYTYNNQWYTDSNAKPANWSISTFKTYEFNVSNVQQYDSNMLKQDYVMSYGKDNALNGRGLLNESTVHNMEKSFDENKIHQMDSYNADGSYNQEIWGYKSFNSPVKFRNGIYDEYSSIISFNDHTGNLAGKGSALQSIHTVRTPNDAASTFYGDGNNVISNISVYYDKNIDNEESDFITAREYGVSSSTTLDYNIPTASVTVNSFNKSGIKNVIDGIPDCWVLPYTDTGIRCIGDGTDYQYDSHSHFITERTLDITNAKIVSSVNLDGETTSSYLTVYPNSITLESESIYFTGNADISGSLNVSGTTTLSATTVSGSLNVSGTTTLSATILSGATTVSGSLNVSGATTINSAIEFNGDTKYNINSTNNIGFIILNGSNEIFKAENNKITISKSAYLTSSTSLNSVYAVNTQITVYSPTTFNNNITCSNIIPGSSSCNLGDSDHHFSSCYINNVRANYIGSDSTSNPNWPEIYANTIDIQSYLNPRSDIVFQAGSNESDHQIRSNDSVPTRFIGQLGYIVNYNSTTKTYGTSAGSLVFGWLRNGTSSAKNYHYGDIISAYASGGSTQIELYEAAFNDTSLDTSTARKLSGYFRLLCKCSVAASGGYAKVFAMHVDVGTDTYNVIS